MKLFMVAAIYLPENENGYAIEKECDIIVKPVAILARDERTAQMEITRMIPQQFQNKLSYVEITVQRI